MALFVLVNPHTGNWHSILSVFLLTLMPYGQTKLAEIPKNPNLFLQFSDLGANALIKKSPQEAQTSLQSADLRAKNGGKK